MINSAPEEKLKERIKELLCLYQISKIISKSNNVNKVTLEEIIFSVVKAWRFCDDSIVEIQINDYTLATALIPKNNVSQHSEIIVSNKVSGFIKVYYPQPKYNLNHFLKEEQELLDTVSFEIGNYIEKYQNLEKKATLRKTLERKDRLSILGEMTAGIAHELNTPLANILGFAELIKDETKDQIIIDDIAKIINSAIYSREIVKKLMFFSCGMPQQLQLLKIKPIVTDALTFLKQNFQKKSVQYQLDFQDDDIIAKVDSIQLTQVLFNLLINAIYVAPKNSIIYIGVNSDEENMILKIADNGPGVPHEIKQKIFDPFFTTKPVGESCGLGLSVVHGIIKNHNGDIEVIDNTPSGTIFLIKLPLQ
ncbi:MULTISPECIES: sensor histidine kinase [unclassified Flavobacterium]|uniref:sensor histidine kinase n=1 Tax=unclassified Flavobacterium TaxID=196869 RepID=UPI000A3D6D74|nr:MULTISPECIES: HAMP domain-containing sensor histidine kinase [unclassified Flavobacterium]MEA9414779.1 HAMP domain-containing sensor histidine kinase [Flavobacterium sp. PL02]OUL60649.1 sensor histidine kinase [Flavobacterium sp. AJR]